MRESLEHFGSKGISPSLSFIHTVKLQCWATKVEFAWLFIALLPYFATLEESGSEVQILGTGCPKCKALELHARGKPLRNSALRLGIDKVTRGYVGEIVGKVWPYVLVGIAIGGFMHGYAPDDFFAKCAGPGIWYAVPLAVLIGVPLYSNAAGGHPHRQGAHGEGGGHGHLALLHDGKVTTLSSPRPSSFARGSASSVCGSLSWPLREARREVTFATRFDAVDEVAHAAADELVVAIRSMLRVLTRPARLRTDRCFETVVLSAPTASVSSLRS